MILHVIPLNDLKPHIESSTCDCDTRSETQESGDIIIIHNSYDGREGLEMAIELLK